MKKHLVILFLILSFFSYSQTQNFGGKIRIGNTPQSTAIDSILIIDGTDRLIKQTRYTDLFAKIFGNLTSYLNTKANLTGATFTGNITAPYFIGNGSLLTNIPSTAVDLSSYATQLYVANKITTDVNKTFVDALGINATQLGGLASSDFVRSTGNIAQTITGYKTYDADAAFIGDGSAGNAPTLAGFFFGKSASDNNRRMEIVAPTSGIGYIDFTNPSVDFRGRILYNTASNFFEFSTNSFTKMKLDANGNLGIGTSNPTQILHLLASNAFVKFQNNTTNWDLGLDAGDSSFKFKHAGVELFRGTNTGNFGFGTSSIGARVEIKGSTSDTSANTLTLRNSSNTSLFSVRNDGRIDVNGNLIINGIANVVGSSTRQPEFKLVAGAGVTDGFSRSVLRFENQNGSNYWRNQYCPDSANKLSWFFNNDERFIFSTAGDLTATSFIGSGASLTNVNATQLGGINSNEFISTSGTSIGKKLFGTIEVEVENEPIFKWSNETGYSFMMPFEAGMGFYRDDDAESILIDSKNSGIYSTKYYLSGYSDNSFIQKKYVDDLLLSLNASNISSGTLADARLSSNIPLLNAGLNTFTGDLEIKRSGFNEPGLKLTDNTSNASIKYSNFNGGDFIKLINSSGTTTTSIKMSDGGIDSGSIRINQVTLKGGTTFANLPASPELGTIRYITDASSVSYRANASGGGSDFALVVFNGTNWIYH